MPEATIELKQGPDSPIRIDTAYGADALVLVEVEGREYISAPFDFNAICLSHNPGIFPEEILYTPASISILQSDDSKRYIHGRVRKLTQGPMSQYGIYTYTLEIVPWLWFLTLNQDCRIFQNKTAVDIIEQVFNDRGFSDYRFRLNSVPPVREYCVQYRETDYNFVTRLMEEEGIYYFFEHEENKHTLILGNANATFAVCPVQSTMPYTSGRGGWGTGDDTLAEVEMHHEVHTGKISRVDYDFTKPANNLLASLQDFQKFEEYDFPGKYTTMARGDALVLNLLEEREANYETINGLSAIRSLRPGYKATITDHYSATTNTEYVLTSVEHRAGPVNYLSALDIPDYTYRNRFTGQKSAIKYRPPLRARKPIVEGEQTAVVVGPGGEEIYTDEYGRVKVHFHWDREGQKNQDDSLWIRVSHAWAGANFGGIYIPRIGQEVVVSFLEGDPDQPLITGRVYNSLQMPPYPLPDHKTRSTIRSRSSKGGGGSNTNEIRFEDKRGSEQVFIHAEKDVDIWVKNDWRTWIGKDYSRIIKGELKEEITKDYSQEIKGHRKEKIAMNRSLEIGMSSKEKYGMNLHQQVGMNQHDKVGMAYAVDAGMEIHLKSGLNVVIEAGVSLTLKVGGNFVNINPAGVSIQGTMVLINSGGAAGAGGGASPEAPEAPKVPDTADDGKGFGAAKDGGGGGGSDGEYTQFKKGTSAKAQKEQKSSVPEPPPLAPVHRVFIPAAKSETVKSKAPGLLGIPGVPTAPVIPGLKGAKLPDTSALGVPPLPSVPSVPSIPKVPGVPSIPKIPGAPPIPAGATDALKQAQKEFNKAQEAAKEAMAKGQEAAAKAQEAAQKGQELAAKGMEMANKAQKMAEQAEKLAKTAEDLATGKGDLQDAQELAKGGAELAEGGQEMAKGGEELAKGTENLIKGS